MRKIIANYGIICLFVLASIACSSAPESFKPIEPEISFGLAAPGKISSFGEITGNPFVEYRSAFFKNNNYFVVFRLETSGMIDGLVIGSINLLGENKSIESITMYREDLLRYWQGYLAGDAAYLEMRSTIERYVPVSERIRTSRTTSQYYLVVLVNKVEGHIDGWKATITVSGGDIEFSGNM